MNSATTTPPRSNWPVNILAAMMFLMPAVGVPNEYMLQDTLKSAIAAFGILLAALAWTWDLQKYPRPLKWHWIIFLPLALCSYALGSMVWSHTYLAGVEAIRWFLLSTLILLILNTPSRQNLPRLLWGIHWGVFIASVWVALQFWWNFKLFPQAAPPSSTFINRNFFAEYAVSVLPLSVYLLANTRNLRCLVPAALSTALNFTAILMTGTRSAMLALIAIVPLMALMLVHHRQNLALFNGPRKRLLLMGVFLLAGIGGMGFIPSDNPEIGPGRTPFNVGGTRSASVVNAVQGKDGAFSIRVELWKSTARMVMANPWTGVGAGAWEVAIPLYQKDDSFSEIDYYAHNEFLQLVAEYGALVGGLVLAFTIAYIARKLFFLQKHTNSRLEALQAFSVITMVAFLLVCSAGFPLHLAASGTFFAIGISLIAIAERSSISGWRELGFDAIGHHALQCVIFVCLLLSVFVTFRAVVSETNITGAQILAVNLARTPANERNLKSAERAELLRKMQTGVRANPHYRKITGTLGDLLALSGDWENATWAWATVAASRPNVVGLWVYLAQGYARIGQHDLARNALKEVQRLRGNSMQARTLELYLDSMAGRPSEAAAAFNQYFDEGIFDYDRLMTAYAVGYMTKNSQLAVRAMALRNQYWPDQAVDGFFRIGIIYDSWWSAEKKLAHDAFLTGFQLAPEDQKQNYLRQVPSHIRDLITK